jgi:hypothetical protein
MTEHSASDQPTENKSKDPKSEDINPAIESSPTEQAKETDKPFSVLSEENADWRIWFGLSISSCWLIMLSIYISGSIGWRNISSAPIETLGNFLEGAFAPLAFLWLVIGYFLQQKELSHNTEAIKMQHSEIQKTADQAVIQAVAIQASELHARRESFLKIAESVKQQLGALLGFLYISSQGETGSGFVSSERLSELWSKMGKSDPEVFARSLLELLASQGERYAYKVLYGTPIRTKHCADFCFSFERLLRAARECDEEGMIVDSVLGSAQGYVYARMIKLQEAPPSGFVFGVYDFDPDTLE